MRWIIPYICVLLLSEVALAQAQVTPPSAVQSKEYADHMPPAGIATTDVDAAGGADFLQIVQWDGLGGASDGSDESSPVGGPYDPDEIDALCGLQDAYFDEVVNNQVLRNGLEKSAEEVQQGASLSRSLARSKLFPPLLTQMVASGESSGRLDSMLEKAATSLEREAEARISVVVSLFEPLMILFMGAVVLIIVMAILLPIFDLNQLVS